HPDLFRLLAWYSLEQKVDSLTERASAHEKKIKAIMNAQSAGLVGTTFTPGFLLTVIMALATAWTPTNPFGLSHDLDAEKMPSKTRDAIAKAISLITKGEEGISN
ncbi:MAG: TetR family transcriptional regulator, partial [Bacilli bacterium]|nr:TetR family transcriptional regulator [Bacilli bacterium]